MGKFIAKSTATGMKFDYVVDEKVILTSEIYKAESSCLNGIQSIQKNAADAGLEDTTLEGCERQKCPKFQIFADKKDDFRFRMVARNGQTIGSSCAFETKEAVQAAIDEIKAKAAKAEIDDTAL